MMDQTEEAVLDRAETAEVADASEGLGLLDQIVAQSRVAATDSEKISARDQIGELVDEVLAGTVTVSMDLAASIDLRIAQLDQLAQLRAAGVLTDDEFAHMKRHPVAGYELLKHTIADQAVLDACLHHHERIDGRGYPHGLQGDAVSELARMNAICDVYDAITSNRPYKHGWSPAVALQRMAQWCHGHLDNRLFSAFVKALGVYPIGSLVRLNNGELAVVYAPCATNLLTPKVVRFYDTTRNQFLCPPKATDLCCVAHLRILQREDPDHWSFPDLDNIWQAAAAQETTACPVLE